MTTPRSTDWLRRSAAAAPDRPALILPGSAVSYAELADRAARAATALHRGFGVEPGARMGFSPLRPRGDFYAALWATWNLGAAAVLVDPSLPDASRIGKRLGAPALLHGIDLDDAAPSHPDLAPVPDDPHTLIMTSGTTGAPRAAVLTHGNVAAAVDASQRRLGNDEEDRWLVVLPLHHVGGMSILWRSVAAGGTVVVHERFDAAAAAVALRSGQVTIASLVPTMLRRILDADPGPYAGVKAVLLGGGAAPVPLVERALDAGLPVLSTYGLTEACSQVATVAPGEQRAGLGTVGRPLDGMEVEIINDAGAAVPAGSVGRITVSGPAVSPGYVGEAPRQGPLVTGDLGGLDAAGKLTVVGRADEVIITGGENVHPARVEAALLGHPEIAAAAVFGIDDPEWGQTVVAAVVGDVPDSELREFVEARLAPHEIPKHWRRLKALPLLPNGKIDRRSLQTGDGT